MGDNVEDVLGSSNFIILYFISGIAAGVIASYVGPYNIPHVGASGAIAGVMAAYLFLFPKAKFILGVLFWFLIPVPIFLYIVFWIAVQFFIVYSGNIHISWSAHLGGFLVGIFLVLLLRKR
jgi:membrane associated rhomboid family serine protease